VWRLPVLLAPALPPPDDPGVAAILDGLCRATGATCCDLCLRLLPEGPEGRYRMGKRGSEPPLEVHGQVEGRFEARWVLCGAGGGPAASPRALEALGPVLQGALGALIDRFNATRQLEILAQMLGVTDDAILLIDAEGEIRYANPRGEELLASQTRKPLNCSRDADAPTPLWDVITAEIAAARQSGGRSHKGMLRFGDGEAWDMEILGLSGQGSLGHTLVVLSPWRFLEAGNIRSRLARFRVSRREAEVLALLLRGKRACEIASALSITEYTVKDHLKHAYAKLGITSRTQLIGRLTGDGALVL
jgi:DNA-binding CsgD family transcriptional regulator